ncbi:MAG: rhodanese-like domain-containing protein [Caldilineaceae bacterium]
MMFAILRRWLGGGATALPHERRPLPPVAEPEEMVVPETTVAQLQQTLAADESPLLLDVREPWEWRQVHIPAARHIPMNEVPAHLAELPQEQQIVVVCAHGSRSYGVAGYLLEQGYQASSLRGGITQWVRDGGDYARATEIQSGSL